MLYIKKTTHLLFALILIKASSISSAYNLQNDYLNSSTLVQELALLNDIQMQKKLNELPIYLDFEQQSTAARYLVDPTIARERKVQQLKNTLKRQDIAAQPWHYAWNTLYTAGLGYNILKSTTASKREDKTLNNVLAGCSIFALLSQNFTERYPDIGGSSYIFEHGSAQEQIKQAEYLLERRANFIKRLNSPLNRLKSYVIGATATAILFDKKQPSDAWLTLGTSLVGIELSRRSLSKTAIRDWDNYQAQQYSLIQNTALFTPEQPLLDKPQSSWGVNPTGISYTLRFH